jgi:hypothetical protein
MEFITWIFPLVALLLLGLMTYCQISILEELRALRRGLGQSDPVDPPNEHKA